MSCVACGWLAISIASICTRPGIAQSHGLPTWRKLEDLPDPLGLAGGFGGVSHGVLLFGGGTNFPIQPPWEGGKKQWYPTVFGMVSEKDAWFEAGELSTSIAYSVFGTFEDRVFIAGGSNESGHTNKSLAIQWRNNSLQFEALPDLPRPIANATGTILHGKLYVIGGQQEPISIEALQSVYVLDLHHRNATWEALSLLPGPGRILAVTAIHQGQLYVVSGAALRADGSGRPEREYLKDAYRLERDGRWTKIADAPYACVAAASPAIETPSGFAIVGGDRGESVGIDPKEHPGFSSDILFFDTASNRWTVESSQLQTCVTLPAVRWRDQTILLSGEKRPGRRSSEVWSLQWPASPDP